MSYFHSDMVVPERSRFVLTSKHERSLLNGAGQTETIIWGWHCERVSLDLRVSIVHKHQLGPIE